MASSLVSAISWGVVVSMASMAMMSSVSAASGVGREGIVQQEAESAPATIIGTGSDTDTELTLRDEIERATEAIAEAQAATTPDEKQVESLQRRLLDLNETLAAEKRLETFQAKSRDIDEARVLAKTLLATSAEPYVNPVIPRDLDEEAFEAGLDAAMTASRVADKVLEEIDREQARRRDRRLEIRKAISETETGLLELESQPGLGSSELVLRRKYRIQLAALEAERRYNDDSDDVVRIELRARIQIAARLDRTLDAWASRASSRRIQEAEATRVEATEAAEAQASPIARAAANENARMALRLATVVSERDSGLAELDNQHRLLNRLKARVDSDDAKFRGRVTPEVAQLLRKRLSEFPDEQELKRRVREVKVMLADLDLDRVLLLDGMDALADPNRFAAAEVKAAGLDGPNAESVVKELVEIYEARLDRYGQPLLAAVNEEIETLEMLVDVDLALAALSGRYRQLVLRETLWIRDVRAFQSGFIGRGGIAVSAIEMDRHRRCVGRSRDSGSVDAAVRRGVSAGRLRTPAPYLEQGRAGERPGRSGIHRPIPGNADLSSAGVPPRGRDRDAGARPRIAPLGREDRKRFRDRRGSEPRHRRLVPALAGDPSFDGASRRAGRAPLRLVEGVDEGDPDGHDSASADDSRRVLRPHV